jgi:hypothetical protein
MAVRDVPQCHVRPADHFKKNLDQDRLRFLLEGPIAIGIEQHLESKLTKELEEVHTLGLDVELEPKKRFSAPAVVL